MPKVDDRTARGWLLPHKKNKLGDDVDRIRETINAIDAYATEIEANIHNVDEVNDALSSRMDVIAGQTTEDTEILDARVDAEGNTHPNLGHNIRSFYNVMLALNSLRLEMDNHLQSQVNENAGTLLNLILEMSRFSNSLDDTAIALKNSIQDVQRYIDSVKSELSDRTDVSVDGLRQNILTYINDIHSNLLDKLDLLRLYIQDKDNHLQSQVNENAYSVLALAYQLWKYPDSSDTSNRVTRLENRLDTLEKLINELLDDEILEYEGAKVARNADTDEMMNDIFDGDGNGGQELSEIPEALKDKVTTQNDFYDMLDEVFQ